MSQATEKILGDLRDRFKDRRIECILMPNDPQPIKPGARGTCYGVDGMGQLLMRWDDGRSLSLIPGIDKFKVISYAL